MDDERRVDDGRHVDDERRADGGEERRTTVVVGVGEGLGSALARRFAAAGDDVGLIARSDDRLESLAATLRSETPGAAVAAPADVTDREAVAAAFDRIRSAFGTIDVVITSLYATSGDGGVHETDHEAFAAPWQVEVAGVYACVREALPDLTDGGTIVVTNSGESVRASAGSVARASARFALRGLAASLARELSPAVHVAQVTVDGWLATPELRESFPDRPDEAWMRLDHVADEYHRLVTQPTDARSFEIDLRTAHDDLT